MVNSIRWSGFFFVVLFTPSAFANCRKAPTSFIDHRIYLKIQTPKRPLLIYTDSGGGLYPFVYRETAELLGMTLEKPSKGDEPGHGLSTLPPSLEGQGVPLPASWKGKVKVFTPVEGGRDEASEIKFFVHDGFFGATFFSNGMVWRFDYSRQELWFCESLTPGPEFKPMDIHFRTTKGIRETHQARMEMGVAGVKRPMLFDTGATSLYSKEALSKLGLKQRVNPSSFIRESVAREWRRLHPGWRVLENGDQFGGGGFLIEVPEVTIAGQVVGPVWFATRKDSVYDQYSAEIMDARIDGAVGGNILKHFEVIADYPGGKLFFRYHSRTGLKDSKSSTLRN